MTVMLDLEKAVTIRTFSHDAPPFTVRFDGGGARVIAGYRDHTIRVWDIETGKCQTLNFHDNWIGQVCVIPGSERFVSAGFDRRLAWWELGAEKPYRSIEAHAGWVRTVAATNDGRLLATGGDDNLIRIWETESGELVREIAASDSFYYSVAFSPDDSQLVAGNLTGFVWLFDVATGDVVRRNEVPDLYTYGANRKRHIGGIRSVGFSRHRPVYFCSGMARVDNVDGMVGTPEVYVFDRATGERKSVLSSKKPFKGMIYQTLCHPVLPLLAGCAGGASGGAVFFWNDSDTKAVLDYKLPKQSRTCDFHPDGTVLIAGCTDGSLRFIDLTGTREAEAPPDNEKTKNSRSQSVQ